MNIALTSIKFSQYRKHSSTRVKCKNALHKLNQPNYVLDPKEQKNQNKVYLWQIKFFSLEPNQLFAAL